MNGRLPLPIHRQKLAVVREAVAVPRCRNSPAALAPFASSSSIFAPSAGLVTFCVATAPVPACAQAQRAATAGDDEEMATPNWPVFSQRATMEKVMNVPFRRFSGTLAQSGMTAVASISTSHSGRASAATTRPVQTGNTPLMYSPIVR